MGEYGTKSQRPHYHCILFGYDFPDKIHWRTTRAGHECYRSPLLEKIWTFGHSEIGALTPQSAGYTAQYVTKKVTGLALNQVDPDTGLKPLEAIDLENGELGRLEQEFAIMSRRPGLGATWFEKYYQDCFPDDFVVIDGAKRAVPDYYRQLLEKKDPQMAETLKRKRREKARIRAKDISPLRLEQMDEHAQITNKARKLIGATF